MDTSLGTIMNNKDDSARGEVAGGLRYAHSRANSNTAKLLEVSSFAYAAIELLAEKGLIDIEVLDRKKKEIAGRLVEKFREEGIGAAYQDPEHDKHTFEGSVEIDLCQPFATVQSRLRPASFRSVSQNVERSCPMGF